MRRAELRNWALAGIGMLLVIFLVATLTLPVRAEQGNVVSGVGSDGLTWVLENGVLTISGNGEMRNGYNKYGVPAPWYEYREQITKVVLEQGVSSVGYGAFEDCGNIAEIQIPESVSSIYPGSFKWCTSLKHIWIHQDNLNFCNDEKGALLNKEQTTLILIPAMLEGEYCIGENIVEIEEYAFYLASRLTSIWLPNTMRECPDFSGCTSLKQILVNETHPTFSNGLDGELYNKSQTVLVAVPAGISGTYTIKEGVVEVKESAFSGCNAITALVLPNSLKFPGGIAWIEGLRAIYISDLKSWCEMGPKDMEEDGYWWSPMVEGCVLYLNGKLLSGEVVIPEGTTRIGFASFYGCRQITSVKFPSTLKVIDECAFADCTGLTEVDIPASVEKLVWQAFIGCTELRRVSIGENVKKIPCTVFWKCEKLETVIFKGDAPEFAEDAFGGTNAFTAYYPYGNSTWTEEVMQDYFGTVTWIPYYPVLSGENSSVEADTEETVSIHAEGELAKFQGVMVNGETVAPENYTVTEGSTVVTLHAAYLRQLGVGVHTVRLLFTDGEALATLTITGGLPGDMDGDGMVKDADAVYLLRHTLFPESYILNGDGDINCDGFVTDADAVYLLRHTLFSAEYPLYPGK